LREATIEEMERHWQEAKEQEAKPQEAKRKGI
jgi:hypothetical protein